MGHVGSKCVSIEIHLNVWVLHVDTRNLINHRGNVTQKMVNVQTWKVLSLRSHKGIGLKIKLKVGWNLPVCVKVMIMMLVSLVVLVLMSVVCVMIPSVIVVPYVRVSAISHTWSLVIAPVVRALLVVVSPVVSVASPCAPLPFPCPCVMMMASWDFLLLALRLPIALGYLWPLVIGLSEIFFFLVFVIILILVRAWIIFLLVSSMIWLVSVWSIISLPLMTLRMRGLHLETVKESIVHSLVNIISQM